jgi:hypothetical protein
MEHVKNKSFNNYWWLFYPLLFFLTGLLVYAMLWSPEHTIEVLRQELNDCRGSHAASSTRPVDGGDNTLPDNIDSLQIGELDKNRALPGEDKKAENTIVNCDAKVESGGQGVTKTKHILGDQSGRVILQYDTKTIPDEIKVYYDGKPIAHTDGLVSGAGQLEWIYEVAPGKPKYCYVEVSAPTPRTVWEYIVNCPL